MAALLCVVPVVAISGAEGRGGDETAAGLLPAASPLPAAGAVPAGPDDAILLLPRDFRLYSPPGWLAQARPEPAAGEGQAQQAAGEGEVLGATERGPDGRAARPSPRVRASIPLNPPLAEVLQRGLPVSVRLASRARVRVTLTVGAQTVRRHWLSARRGEALVVGRATYRLGEGRERVRVRPSRRYARKLQWADELRFLVRVTATGPDGSRRTARTVATVR